MWKCVSMFATCHWLFTTCQFFQDHQFDFLLFTLHLFVPANFQRLRRCFTTSQLANHRWIQGFWVLMPINIWRRQPSSHSPVVAPRVIWSISRTKSFSLFGEELPYNFLCSPCVTGWFPLWSFAGRHGSHRSNGGVIAWDFGEHDNDQ